MNSVTIRREEETHDNNRRYIVYIEFFQHFLVIEIVGEWKHSRGVRQLIWKLMLLWCLEKTNVLCD
jgi:hypothetical protein